MSKYLELVEGSFTQEHLNKQNNQKPYVAYSIKDDKVIYTIIPNEGGTMYTVYRVVSKDISNYTYNMVDLGLSVKWADKNVGATSPEEYGSYFQWGDTNAYTYDGAGKVTAAELAETLNLLFGSAFDTEITADNVHEILTMILGEDPGYDLSILGSSFCISIDKLFNWDTYFDTTDSGNTFTKYNNKGGLTVLESNDDAAAVHMSSEWRMPTYEEIRELKNNTTQTFIDIQGNEYSEEEAENGAISEGNLKGVKFTGSNGNSIFIPAAGYCTESLLYGGGIASVLWSSSLEDSFDDNARHLAFMHDGLIVVGGYNYRRFGYSIRGVKA